MDVEMETWEPTMGKGIDDVLSAGELPDVVKYVPSTAPPSATPATRFPIVTMSELITSDYRCEWLVRGVWVRNQPGMMSGPKKVLKTTIALELALSLASGSPFLGKWKVEQPTGVAFMSAESGPHTIQETVLRICESKAIDPTTISNLSFCWNVPKFDSVAHVVELEKFLDATAAKVVFIDPVYMTMGGADAANIFSMGERLKNISDLCAARDVTPILLHHFRKTRTESDTPALEDVAFAGFQEFARQWLLLDRAEEYVPGSGEHKLVMSYGGSAGHSGAWSLAVSEGVTDGNGSERWWAAEVTPLERKIDRTAKRKQEAHSQAVAECTTEIEKAFNAVSNSPMTVKELGERSGKSGKSFQEAIAGMIQRRELETATVERKNKQTYEGYRRTYKGSEPPESIATANTANTVNSDWISSVPTD